MEYQPEFVTTLDKDIIADSKPAAGHIYGAGTLMLRDGVDVDVDVVDV